MSYSLSKLTPNLVVANVERSAEFYRDVLGFSVQMTVPDAPPFAFAIVTTGSVEVFLNSAESALSEYPAFASRPIGGTLTLFIEVVNIQEAYEALKGTVDVVMPLEKKWYGVTEFAFLDPDGYIITYAERAG